MFYQISYIIINVHNYVKGRTIFDAVRTIDDVMEFSERYNLEGRMVCRDFKKAFDTVSRDFLFRPLTSFGFGPPFFIHFTISQVAS